MVRRSLLGGYDLSGCRRCRNRCFQRMIVGAVVCSRCFDAFRRITRLTANEQ